MTNTMAPRIGNFKTLKCFQFSAASQERDKLFLQTGNISIVGPRTLKQFEVTRFQVLKGVDHFKVSVDVTFERILSYHVTNTFIPTLRCQQNVILCHMYFKRVL